MSLSHQYICIVVTFLFCHLSITTGKAWCDRDVDETNDCYFHCTDKTKKCSDFHRKPQGDHGDCAHPITDRYNTGDIFCTKVEGWEFQSVESDFNPYTNDGCNDNFLHALSWTKNKDEKFWMQKLRRGCHSEAKEMSDITHTCGQFNGKAPMPKKNGKGVLLKAADVGGDAKKLTVYEQDALGTPWYTLPCVGLSEHDAKERFDKFMIAYDRLKGSLKVVDGGCTSAGTGCGDGCSCHKNVCEKKGGPSSPLSTGDPCINIGKNGIVAAYDIGDNVYGFDDGYVGEYDWNSSAWVYGVLVLGLCIGCVCMGTMACSVVFGYLFGRGYLKAFMFGNAQGNDGGDVNDIL